MTDLAEHARPPIDADTLPAELVRLVDAACAYVDLYGDELAEQAEGGTSRELLAAVAAWRHPTTDADDARPVTGRTRPLVAGG